MHKAVLLKNKNTGVVVVRPCIGAKKGKIADITSCDICSAIVNLLKCTCLRAGVMVPRLSCVLSECSGPLGMEGGIISNQQITASSTHRALFGLQKWYPYFARLNKKGLVNAWTAAENDRWPWIQVTHIHMGRRSTKKIRAHANTHAFSGLTA